jgi:hypothetical protein
MNVSQLAKLTESPETHRMIVGDYAGQYVLGVTDSPAGFLLRVADTDTSRFPRRVVVDGQSVPVQVTGGFASVVPLASKR